MLRLRFPREAQGIVCSVVMPSGSVLARACACVYGHAHNRPLNYSKNGRNPTLLAQPGQSVLRGRVGGRQCGIDTGLYGFVLPL